MEGKEGVLEARNGHHWVKRGLWELPSWISSPPCPPYPAQGRRQALSVEWPQSWDERFQILYGLLGNSCPHLWKPTSGLQVFPITGQVVISSKIL